MGEWDTTADAYAPFIYNENLALAGRQLLNDAGHCGSTQDRYGNNLDEILSRYYTISYQGLEYTTIYSDQFVDEGPARGAIWDYIFGQDCISKKIFSQPEEREFGIACSCAADYEPFTTVCIFISAQHVVNKKIVERIPVDDHDVAHKACDNLCPYENSNSLDVFDVVYVNSKRCPKGLNGLDTAGWCKTCHDISSHSGDCCYTGGSSGCCEYRYRNSVDEFSPMKVGKQSDGRTQINNLNCWNPGCSNLVSFQNSDFSTVMTCSMCNGGYKVNPFDGRCIEDCEEELGPEWEAGSYSCGCANGIDPNTQACRDCTIYDKFCTSCGFGYCEECGPSHMMMDFAGERCVNKIKNCKVDESRQDEWSIPFLTDVQNFAAITISQPDRHGNWQCLDCLDGYKWIPATGPGEPGYCRKCSEVFEHCVDCNFDQNACFRCEEGYFPQENLRRCRPEIDNCNSSYTEYILKDGQYHCPRCNNGWYPYEGRCLIT